MTSYSTQAQPSERNQAAWGPWKFVLLTTLAVVGLVLVWLGRVLAADCTRLQAVRCLEQYSSSAALDWLRWCDWLAPEDGRAELLRARAFRHLQRDEQLILDALAAAKREGADHVYVEQEGRLHAIASGAVDEHTDQELIELIATGLSPHEVCMTVVFGYLQRRDPDSAQRVLDAYAADFPDEPHSSYLRGMLRRSIGDPLRAEAEFQEAIEGQERHELAALALARLYEEQQQEDDALKQWIETAERFPASDAAHIGLAQRLRESGRPTDARAVLKPRLALASPSRDVLLEACHIELEIGDYEAAAYLLQRTQLDRESELRELLDRSVEYAMDGMFLQANNLLLDSRAVATALALAGQQQRAEWFFDQIDATHSYLQRRNELRSRLDQNAADKEVAKELDALLASRPAPANVESSDVPESGMSDPSPAARNLYVRQCAACHGRNGDGNGRAARHLTPRPRNLRHHRFRLVSTRNAVPAVADVAEVIRRGMPGTSMPAFPDLSPQERQMIAEEVLRLRSDGLRESLAKEIREPASDSELKRLLKLHTTPGPRQPVPAFSPPDVLTLARGKEAFEQLSCHQCHQTKRESSQPQVFFDEEGRPAPARDLAREPYKGGIDARSIYLRLRLGMPGTAHPAVSSAPDETLVAVTHYVRSLAEVPHRTLTNHQRSLRNNALLTGSAGESSAAERASTSP